MPTQISHQRATRETATETQLFSPHLDLEPSISMTLSVTQINGREINLENIPPSLWEEMAKHSQSQYPLGNVPGVNGFTYPGTATKILQYDAFTPSLQ
jgi:hypothetical protein